MKAYATLHLTPMPSLWPTRTSWRFVAAFGVTLTQLFTSLALTLLREQQFSAETERFFSDDLERIRLLTDGLQMRLALAHLADFRVLP